MMQVVFILLYFISFYFIALCYFAKYYNYYTVLSALLQDSGIIYVFILFYFIMMRVIFILF